MSTSTDGQMNLTSNHAATAHQEEFNSVDLEQNEKSAREEHAPQPFPTNPELEKRVLRKIDMHVTPLVTFLCMCSTTCAEVTITDQNSSSVFP
jgi:hypothetical protein